MATNPLNTTFYKKIFFLKITNKIINYKSIIVTTIKGIITKNTPKCVKQKVLNSIRYGCGTRCQTTKILFNT